jgi:N-acetyl sugar amidotransferase
MPSLFKNLKIINPDDKVVYCKRCVLSNQRPRTMFNDDGVCSPCLFSEYKHTIVDWNKREKELSDLCDKYRSKDGSWDVLVPSSGGKDSGYVAYTLKEKYGMRPLTVTWASMLQTEIGKENLENFINSGYDNILMTPNGKIHRKLSKLTFTEFGDNFLPFSYGQVHMPLHIAVKYKIPLIMYGENGELEYGGDLKNYNKPTLDPAGHDYVLEKFTDHPPEYWKSYGINMNELKIYMPPSIEELKQANIQEHYFSYYENWSPEKHYEVARKYLGFKPSPTRSEGTYSNYASLDDKTDGFHYYMAFIKFGIARTTSDAAHQIRDGIITRDEGVDLVRKYDGEFPAKYLKDFLECFEMNMETLFKIFDKFRRSIIWKRENDQWILRQQVTKLT